MNDRFAPEAAVPSVICCLNASDLVDTLGFPDHVQSIKRVILRLGAIEKVKRCMALAQL
jgi:hypothetical protein